MNKAFLLKAIFLFTFVTFCLYSKAQNLEENPIKRDTTHVPDNRPRTVFLEIGGPGLALTVNYDTRYNDNNARDKWGYRVGAGYYNTGANWVATVPFQINYLYGGRNSFLELGAGTTFVRSVGTTGGTTFQFDNITGFIGTATIGYRYQQENGGINFRIAFVPILYDDGLLFEGGVSIGYTF
ncbi:MAG: hypothetical protein JWQ84_675 [Mucilaginibacter sp.]|jgi:hypothetical protein|nr:hypothetical protein [Mucilaginibacter sp.]MDB5015843.1 hypothetical protein [Mucilaginibacter sp.]MDB5140374.1 hypothetical protein [Mucilaginibacter sp.]